jgi:SanA protein
MKIRFFSLRKFRIPRVIKYMVLLSMALVIVLVLTANRVIEKTAKDLVYDQVDLVPYNKVGLLLGTSRTLSHGRPNRYFFNRTKAAVDLYNHHKVSYIVISGDNGRESYNEPQAMKEELMKRGVPEGVIFLDFAGFRTYDSVIRLNRIFGQKSFTVISQKFHNERAVYIAKAFGWQAVGYNATDVDAYHGFKTKQREKLARVKVFVDLLFNKKPKFLGDPVVIK